MAKHPTQHAGHSANPAVDNTQPVAVSQPQFGEVKATPDPTRFFVKHASDTAAYAILDKLPHQPPLPFPKPAGGDEPILRLQDTMGAAGAGVIDNILKHGQIVFHAVGDTGNTRSTHPQSLVADKMASDYVESNVANVPAFFYHLGDVVYSFGESEYYYDQFYDPYRDYPAPILAIAGNHDGMVAPGKTVPTLQAFLENFCALGAPHKTPEAGELPRTAMIQPGVYFTLEAPFVRILGLYSNRLENPGIISSEGDPKSPLKDWQLDFLNAALERVKTEAFSGALIIAVHHPPYTSGGKHPGSPRMLKDIDDACKKAGVWPHAVLSAHAHNYQRFTRILNPGSPDEMHVPYIVAGNGGHGITQLVHVGGTTLRTPVREQAQEKADKSDQVVFENYDDRDYGYLRIVADNKQLRIEYHPQADGTTTKTPDDFVTVDLASHQLVHYSPIGTRGKSKAAARPAKAKQPSAGERKKR